MRSRLLLRALTAAHLVCLVRLLRQRPAVVRGSCSTPCRLGDECRCWREGWADSMEHRYQRGQQRNGYGEVVLDWNEPTDPLLDETRLHDLHVVNDSTENARNSDVVDGDGFSVADDKRCECALSRQPHVHVGDSVLRFLP